MTAPVLRTARLVLRPFVPADLDAYTALRAEPENIRFLPGGVAGAAEAPAKARRLVEAWSAAGWSPGPVPWAVELDGRLVGHLGLLPVDELGEVELLYMLDRPARGRGLATEGARAAIDFARHRLGLSRLVAFALPENVASQAVMRRCGFSLQGPIRIFGLDALRYGLDLAAREAARPGGSATGP